MSISSDLFLLIVAMPILIAVRLPLRQKMILLVLFGLGGFVIIAAILTKIYCLVPSLISYVYMNWYFREATVAMLVTNLPLTWSLIRDIFPGLKSWANADSNLKPATWPRSSRSGTRSDGRRSRNLQLKPFHDMTWDEKQFRSTETSESREGINHHDFEEEDRAIHVQNDVTLDIERASSNERLNRSNVWDWNGNPHHVSSTEVAGGAGRH
jgi:hypothetical protein